MASLPGAGEEFSSGLCPAGCQHPGGAPHFNRALEGKHGLPDLTAQLLPKLTTPGESTASDIFPYLISSHIKAQRPASPSCKPVLRSPHSDKMSMVFLCDLEGILAALTHFDFHFQKTSLTYGIALTNSAGAAPGPRPARKKPRKKSGTLGSQLRHRRSPGCSVCGTGRARRKRCWPQASGSYRKQARGLWPVQRSRSGARTGSANSAALPPPPPSHAPLEMRFPR